MDLPQWIWNFDDVLCHYRYIRSKVSKFILLIYVLCGAHCSHGTTAQQPFPPRQPTQLHSPAYLCQVGDCHHCLSTSSLNVSTLCRKITESELLLLLLQNCCTIAVQLGRYVILLITKKETCHTDQISLLSSFPSLTDPVTWKTFYCI